MLVANEPEMQIKIEVTASKDEVPGPQAWE